MYKEYLAHVPSKWAEFTGSGVPPKPGKSTFGHALPRSKPEMDAFQRELAEAEERSTRQHASRRRGPMGESWIEEMKVEVAAEKQRAESKMRTKKLDEQLTRKHARYIERKEREMLPPTLDGKPMPGRYYGAMETHPREVKQFQAMLSSASDVALQQARAKIEDFAAKKQEECEDQAQKRHEKLTASVRRAVAERREAVHETFEAHERKLQRALARRDELAEAHDEHVKETTDKAEAHRRDAEARLSQQRDRRDQEAAARAALATEKLERITAAKRAKQDAFEEEMNERQRHADGRCAVIDAMRHRKVEQQEGAKAYARAMERREKVRERQLEEGRQGEARRQERLRRIEEQREEQLAELKAVHEHREARTDGRKAEQWDEREVSIERELERTHEPRREFRSVERRTPAYLSARRMSMTMSRRASMSPAAASSKRGSPSPPPPGGTVEDSLTLQRLSHASRKLARQKAEAEVRRQEAVQQQLDRERSIAAATSLEHQQVTQRQRQLQEKRVAVRAAAAEREEQHQARVDEEASRREAQAEQQLASLSEARRRETEATGAERHQKIMACIDEVNVQARERLMAEMDDKARRREQTEEKQRLEREAKNQKAQAERDARNRRIQRQVQQTAAERDAKAQARRQDHEARVDHALAQRDTKVMALQSELRRKNEVRAQKARDAAEAAVARNRQLAAEVARDERAHTDLLEAQRTEQAEEARRRAKELEERRDDHVEAHLQQHRDKVERTQEKLHKVAERAHSSLDVRRDRVREVEHSARVHAHTPLPSVPQTLLSHERTRRH